MGNSASRFSNALPFPIKVQVFQDETRIAKFREVTNHDLQVKAGASYSIPAGAKAEIQTKYGFKYEKVAEGTVKYADADNQGYVIIPPGCSQKWDGPLDSTNNYLSVYIVMGTGAGQSYLLEYFKGYKCKSPIRKVFCLNPHSRNKTDFNPKSDVAMADIAKEPKTWRFAPQSGPANHNYPPGYTCTQCGRSDRCVKSCKELAEYGGCSL